MNCELVDVEVPVGTTLYPSAYALCAYDVIRGEIKEEHWPKPGETYQTNRYYIKNSITIQTTADLFWRGTLSLQPAREEENDHLWFEDVLSLVEGDVLHLHRYAKSYAHDWLFMRDLSSIIQKISDTEITFNRSSPEFNNQNKAYPFIYIKSNEESIQWSVPAFIFLRPQQIDPVVSTRHRL